MRILVVSDTHGNDAGLRRALLAQPKAEVVIHLGDGEEEVQRARGSFPEKMFLQVRGNCDWGSSLPVVGEYTVDGVKVFYTHGHLYGVKSGFYTLECAAREKKAQVALFGHTHVRELTRGVGAAAAVFNPGSLRDGGSYGVITVTDGQCEFGWKRVPEF